MPPRPLDRAKLAKLLNATRAGDSTATAMAMRTANTMLDASETTWEKIIPGAKVKLTTTEHPPPFVGAIELTLGEAVARVLESRHEDRRELAGVIQNAMRGGDTVAPHGIRMMHKWAMEEFKR